VHLSSGRIAEVTVFDARPILVELLCNEDLIKRDNLVYNDNDFLHLDEGMGEHDDVYDNMNLGTWWKDMSRKMK
jgi:hypothetical protein